MKKVLSLILVALLCLTLAFTFAGCGEEAATSGESNVESTQEDTKEVVSEKEKTPAEKLLGRWSYEMTAEEAGFTVETFFPEAQGITDKVESKFVMILEFASATGNCNRLADRNALKKICDELITIIDNNTDKLGADANYIATVKKNLSDVNALAKAMDSTAKFTADDTKVTAIDESGVEDVMNYTITGEGTDLTLTLTSADGEKLVLTR
ncbi:MAG: hypothetical protein IJ462_02010 [Clostridia bacterium]|nr:hypothetical protein [Clostridia bacterium]